MSTFVLHLQGGTQYERIDDAVSFVAADGSGSFGLLAGHARFMACLGLGLARFRAAEGPWHYLALPGAVLYFVDNALYVNTRRYLHDPDYRRVSAAWRDELLAEEEKLRSVAESLNRLEDEMLKRLWSLQREGRGAA
ncbi:MAG: H+transporting two-sector ATPase delta/epsilon subunit [Rhodocyclaceae bacterium]|nr:H+transporting two-sector ATPase delta/epsilon subunit [Rhodocyclaceae bacterium]